MDSDIIEQFSIFKPDDDDNSTESDNKKLMLEILETLLRKNVLKAARFENYEIISQLEGPEGCLFVVKRDKSLETDEKNYIAIERKILNMNSGNCLDFVRKIQFLTELKHENVVQVENVFFDVEFDSENNKLYFCNVVMPYIKYNFMSWLVGDGKNFSVPSSEIPNSKRSFEEVRDMLQQAIGGIDYLHRHELPHYDIRFENLLITADQKCLVSDPGIVQNIEIMLSYVSETSEALKKASLEDNKLEKQARKQELEHIAPEVKLLAKNMKDEEESKKLDITDYLTTKADVYAFGVLLYRLFVDETGEIDVLKVNNEDLAKRIDKIFGNKSLKLQILEISEITQENNQISDENPQHLSISIAPDVQIPSESLQKPDQIDPKSEIITDLAEIITKCLRRNHQSRPYSIQLLKDHFFFTKKQIPLFFFEAEEEKKKYEHSSNSQTLTPKTPSKSNPNLKNFVSGWLSPKSQNSPKIQQNPSTPKTPKNQQNPSTPKTPKNAPILSQNSQKSIFVPSSPISNENTVISSPSDAPAKANQNQSPATPKSTKNIGNVMKFLFVSKHKQSGNYNVVEQNFDKLFEEAMKFLYLQNYGISNNYHTNVNYYEKARNLFDNAASYNHNPSTFMLGVMCFMGWGFPNKDIEKAKELIGSSLVNSLPYLDNFCKRGDKIIQFMLGQIYYLGIGIEKDDATAFRFWKLAAEKESPNALFQVGVCYEMRIGISQDLFKAFEYYQKSANLNFANAQFQLGVCYENGIVQKDFEQAFKFYELAAKQEHLMAQHCLGRCYEMGIGVTIDLEKAFQMYKLSAQLGNTVSQEKMAQLFETGVEGLLEKSPEKAKFWRLKLAETLSKSEQHSY